MVRCLVDLLNVTTDQIPSLLVKWWGSESLYALMYDYRNITVDRRLKFRQNQSVFFFKISNFFLIRTAIPILSTEVDTESPGNAKTPRIMLYAQNWGRLPKVGLGLLPGLSVSTSVVSNNTAPNP